MQNKIKILILAAVLIAGGIFHTVSAVTINSTETVTADRTVVMTVTGITSYDGDICLTEVSPGVTYCPTATNNYTDTTYLNGVSQGTTNITCAGTNNSVLECAHVVEKTTSQTCTYTTDVVSWGECSAGGVQYATAYNYATVAGSTCTDQAPESRSCDPEDVPRAICPFISTPESPVINLNGGLSRTEPSINVLTSSRPPITKNVNLAEGEYIVEAISWDGYATRAANVQPNEQYNIQFILGETVIDSVGPTTDIADGVLEDTQSDSFGPITLEKHINKIRFIHVPQNPGNSVVPVCIKITKTDVANPEPTLTFNPDPGTIESGDSSVLKWTPTNADTCTATGGWSGSKSNTGDNSEVVYPTENTLYYLECWNSEGDSTGKRIATVFVTGAAETAGGPEASEPSETSLDVEISAQPNGDVNLGTEIRWTATASGGTGPYSFTWSSPDFAVTNPAGSYPSLPSTITNYIDGRISEVGDATVYVTVHDDAGDSASDDYTSYIIEDRRPQ